jgi:CRP-like cAMP-binding protein
VTGYEPLIVQRDWNRSTDSDWAEVLGGLPLFSQIGKRNLRKIVKQGQLLEFAPGDTVISTGAPADSFFVIVGGRAEAFGKPAAHTLKTGDYFGEMGLLDNGTRSASVVATDELHVLKLPRQAFLELLGRNPELAQAMLSELVARVRMLESQPPRVS